MSMTWSACTGQTQSRLGKSDSEGAELGSSMTEIEIPGLLEHFNDLPDPREPRGVRHKLVYIIGISILAVIRDADNFTEIQECGVAKREWLEGFLELPHGIPSHDTFQRVFAALDPDAWQARFPAWTQTLVLPELPEGEDEVLAVDGKTARRSHKNGLGALHTVSVWPSQFEIVLA